MDVLKNNKIACCKIETIIKIFCAKSFVKIVYCLKMTHSSGAIHCKCFCCCIIQCFLFIKMFLSLKRSSHHYRHPAWVPRTFCLSPATFARRTTKAESKKEAKPFSHSSVSLSCFLSNFYALKSWKNFFPDVLSS